MAAICLVFLKMVPIKNKPLTKCKGFLYLSKSISRILSTDDDIACQYPYHLSAFIVTNKL